MDEWDRIRGRERGLFERMLIYIYILWSISMSIELHVSNSMGRNILYYICFNKEKCISNFNENILRINNNTIEINN